ncbi:unnamed protein product, partial [Didymodactylos carnosus]
KCFTVKNINYELSNMSSELNTTMLMFTTGHSVLITLVNSWAYQQVITYNWLPLLVHYMTPFCIVSVLTTYFVSLIASFTQKQENSKPLFILSLTSEEIHYRFKLNPSLALSLFLSLLFSLENIFNPINLMPNKIASLSFENLFKSYPFELIRWLHPAMFLFQRYKFPPQLRNFICAVILSGSALVLRVKVKRDLRRMSQSDKGMIVSWGQFIRFSMLFSDICLDLALAILC